MTRRSALADRLDELLHDFGANSRGLRGAVVADPNGLPVSAVLPPDMDPGVIAAMGALLAQSAHSVYATMKFADPDLLIIEGKEACIVALSLGHQVGSLVGILEKDANLGLVKIELKKVAAKVAEALGGGTAPPRITELFVMYRGGALIRHYSDTLRTDHDRDILGGMLAAIQAFVREALAAKEGGLDQMQFGAYGIGFVRGSHTIAAVVTEGDTEAARYIVFDALKDFEERFQKPLENWGGSVQDFPGIDDCFGKVLHPG